MQRSYYAIIPANVRYDQYLSPNAKLLYGEITALCNERGYCWANNAYFADLYKVSKKSISGWINQLINSGYIHSEIQYKDGSKEILHRYLRIVPYPTEEKFHTPMEEKVKDNNTVFNITSNKKEEEEAPQKMNPFRFYEENGFGTIGGYISDEIKAWENDLSEELVLEAMKIAVEYGAKNWAYVNRILINWKEKKLTSIQQVNAELQAFKNGQSSKRKQGRADHGKTQAAEQFALENGIPF